MATQTVRQACTTSELVNRDDLVDQIANLEDLNDPTRLDAGEFFRRNHFTEGLQRLLHIGFERLSGRSDSGAFYLSQSMGNFGRFTQAAARCKSIFDNAGIAAVVVERRVRGWRGARLAESAGAAAR